MTSPAARVQGPTLPEAFELVIRPRAVLSRCAGSGSGGIGLLAAMLAPVFAIAAFFAFTYAGTVTFGHLLANVALFLGVVTAQALLATLLARVVGGPRSWRTLLHGFALTYLPLEIFFLAMLAVFLIAADPYSAVWTLARTWVLPSVFLLALAWSALLTYLWFRVLTRRAAVAIACTVGHYVVFGGLVWVYVVAMDLLPLPVGR